MSSMSWITLGLAAAVVAGSVAVFFGGPQKPPRPVSWIEVEDKSPERPDKVIKTDEQWKASLTPEQYKILRRSGTEPAFCGIFHDNKKNGVYVCAGCDLELFRSTSKFDSGTGWPSFLEPVDRKNVWLKRDLSHGMDRVEVLCSRCDGHLGHVFPDGPPPTGHRYCINSASLNFLETQ